MYRSYYNRKLYNYYFMDFNKLKNRLNVKFQPIKSKRKSLKKLDQASQIDKSKNEEGLLGKARSTSQVRLPSLNNRSKVRFDTVQDSKSYVNAIELREKARSFREIPKVKIESKESINNTLTYLMKSQILTVPRIVALLQKNQSDQFIYFKVLGIYQFQACEQKQKGSHYVTVSRNGMVQNGELIPLETLVRQFQIFKKLKKVGYFKNFHLAKYLHRWKEVFKKKRFVENRFAINKLLHLSDKKYLEWKIQIFNLFDTNYEGGWLQQSWIHKIGDKLKHRKEECQKRLIQICFKMLQSFELPISQSTDLLNRVLGNLGTLNITFQKKIRIQKECEKFYKLGRQLQLNSMQKTAAFILDHLRSLTKKAKDTTRFYVANILQRLEQLDIKKEQYVQEKQKILLDSTAMIDIDYLLYYNQQENCLAIRPSPQDIFYDCMAQIKAFIKQMQKMGFRMIRTPQFRFITKNIFKSGENENEEEEQSSSFKIFVNSIPIFDRLCDQLQSALNQCNEPFNQRIQLFKPFLNLYCTVKQNNLKTNEFSYIEIYNQYEDIQQNLKFCQKLDEGQHFIMGFLKTHEFKKDLIGQIKNQQQRLFKKIPIQLNLKREKISNSLIGHLQILNNQQANALSFIKISEQIQIIEQNLLEYASGIEEIQKIQQFYQKNSKKKLKILQEQKKNLNQVKLKMKSFIQSKQSNFLKYRKTLEFEKQVLSKKILSYNEKQDEFYDARSNPEATYQKLAEISKNLKSFEKQLSELNNLQTFYNLKPSSFSFLQMRIKQYEILQQIWKNNKSVDNDQSALAIKLIKTIDGQKYIKFYDLFKRKSQKYMKDLDLTAITTATLTKVQRMIQNMETIQLINATHLRQSDLDEINYHIQRKCGTHNYGSIKCRQMAFQIFSQLRVSQMKPFIAETVFKAKKQIQITQNLVQFNQWWKGIRLQHQFMEQYPLIAIFGQNLKLRDQIDQYMTILINILNNKYGSFVRNQCSQLLKKMNSLIQMLQLAEIHQQKFLNLFPILTSKYAESQLSSQCKKFDSILTKTMKNIRVLGKPTEHLHQGTKSLLNNHIKHFDSISHVLSNFLERKRVKFQRFYFLQDSELLEVLVGIADEKNVFRMFEGIKGWLVSQDGIKIGVIGVGDQKLLLKGWNYKNVEPQMIFKNLEDAIKSNLNSIVRNILYQYQVQLKDLRSLYSQIPWMCLYAVQMILYTKQVELNCFHQNIPLESQESLIKQAINHAIVKPTQYSNYITMLLHLLHFTEQMRKQNVNSIFDFQWHSFLRFYYQKQSTAIRSLNNQIKWGGQYQGMWSLMVNTSDIARAHICVLNNIQHANGVLLQGPSGTGKTESLKELARCTAKYCVIFNCSQNVNLKTISKLLSGLCYTASWLCLDQINRLTIEAMSVIAKQIQTIKNAILSKKQQFSFMGKDIKLRKGVAIFSTMNPIYLKRAKLTQNIKSYFRTITVAMPDHERILQILLYGLKFFKPRELAQKISVTFYNLSVQLSKSTQYDFGLRAMKFLVGILSKSQKISDNQKYQNQIVAKAFYEIFFYRLPHGDRKIFEKVVFDLFKYKPQNATITMQDQINAMKESPQTGIIVFGPVSAKSTLIKKYCQKYESPQIILFNPNSVDLKYFLGQSIHGRWEEGIVQKISRMSLGSPQKMHLLILDSTLKSQIIQNFNTLLDQSRLLTIFNGTRLKIGNNLKLIMETPHLNLISPSTITRCNIIYTSDKDVDTKSLIQAQLPQGLAYQQIAKRIRKIYERLTNNQIREVGKLSKIIISQKYDKKITPWKDNQVLGVEKAVIFAARLLKIQNKITAFIVKQNSFHIKKNPFHYILAFQRYAEGQFLEISRSYEPIIQYNSFMLKTSQQIFMKYIVKRATSRQMQPILWKGSPFRGKSKGLNFSLKSQKYMKISFTKQMGSTSFIKLLVPLILDKKVEQVKQRPELIIYLENLHLCSEQAAEKIRFMMEHNKIFSVQIKQILPIQAMAFLAESRHFQTKQFDRVRQHFSQLQIPEVDQIQMKNIFYQLVKHYLSFTDLQETLKNSINLESQRFCSFLGNICQSKNQNKTQKNKIMRLYSVTLILQRIKQLNAGNCQNMNDFMAFMFQAIKIENSFKQEPQEDLLNINYLQFYKGKFVKQYQTYLKNQNFILKKIGPIVSQANQKKQQSNKKYIQSQLLQMAKNLYISKFVRQQIQIALRMIQNQNSHFCLIGQEGSGRKTILALACKIAKVNFLELQSQFNQKQIRKIYFEKIRNCLETQSEQIIILDLKYSSHAKFLEFAQSIAVGSSVVSLFQSEQTDYMFQSISDFVGDDYTKSSKSYQQVCQDYVMISQKKLHFLIVASPEDGDTIEIFKNYQTLFSRTYFRNLPEFSIQSLIQSIELILNKKISSNAELRQNLSIERLPKIFMKIYKVFYGLFCRNKQNNILHFNFNQFHILKMVQMFCDQFLKALMRLKEQSDVLNKSILKISEIDQLIIKLKSSIQKMEPDVEVKKQRMLQVAPILQQKKKNTEAIKYAVQSEKKEIQIKKDEIEGLMKEVEDQIAEAQPLLLEAIDSVQTIKRTQLSEIKNNVNPHPLIKFTMQNMVILLGQPENWQNVRKILSDANLLVRIKSCSPSHEAYLRVKKRINQNTQCTFQAISKISFGARYLFKWIKSIVKYKDIEQQIQKKKKYVQKLKINLKNSQQNSKVKIMQLANKQKDSIQIQVEYSKISKQLNDIQSIIDSNKRKLANSEKIKKSLQHSAARWQQKLAYFKEVKSYLSSYCIFLSIQISLFPNLNYQEIDSTRKQIIKVFNEESFPMIKELNVFSDLISNNKDSLFDKFDHQDAKDQKKVLLAYHFNGLPFIIDPDSQASNWLARLNLSKRIIYTKKTFPGAAKAVEEAMRFGQILAVLTDGRIDDFCKQILKSLQSLNSSQYYVQYNKNTFKMNPQFKLLFFSRSKNPHINLNTSLKHQIINFEITKMSLQQSLLNSALRAEKPELYQIKSQMEQSNEKAKRKLQEIESQIIEKLLNNKKNIIEDESFVELLNENKSASIMIAENKKIQQNQIQEIQQFVRQFNYVCSEAADIFISLKQMGRLNSLLLWDVEIFAKYFSYACISSISYIQESYDENVFKNDSFVGAYEFQQYNQSQSRPTTALSNLSVTHSRVASQQNEQNLQNLISARTQYHSVKQQQQKMQQKKVDRQQIRNSQSYAPKSIFQLKKVTIDESKKGFVTQQRFFAIIQNLINILKKSFSWKQRNIWSLLLALKTDKKQDIKILINLLISEHKKRTLQSMMDQNIVTEGIKNYFSKFEGNKVENEALRILSLKDNISSVVGHGISLTEFLIISSIMFPENVMNFIKKIIKHKRVQCILNYEQQKISDWLYLSDSCHPILLLMGEDPIQMISQFLQRNKFKNATLVAMGQEQNKKLDTNIEQKCRKQGIFIIHNVHIGVNFLPLLIRLIQQFATRPPHKNFRLILISSLQAQLPSQLTSMCHKFIVEQPSGLINKMKGLYEKSQSQIDHSKIEQHRLTYSLCLMHSIVNQMKKYGSLCWNFPPSYSTSDFLSALQSIRTICNKEHQIQDYHCNIDSEQIQRDQKKDNIDFVGLRYLIGQTCYVGKMSDNIDRKKMRIIVENHFNQHILKDNYTFWQGSQISRSPQQVLKKIQSIDEENTKTCGLYDNAPMSKQISNEIFKQMKKIVHQSSLIKKQKIYDKFFQLKPINHPVQFVNEEIQKYNLNGVYQPRSTLLKQIEESTKIFNLKSFANPQQLFVSIKLQLAMKNNVPYDNVTLVWSIAQKQGSFGIKNLTLEGGNIKNGNLVVGTQQKQITLFFTPIIKKKDKDPNKGKVAIPLYLSQQRGQSIGINGENTNLLTEVYMDSKEQAESWVIKGTSFVVC